MKTFTSTSTEPYDRHFYIITYKDGRTYTYDDYEHVRLHYFQQMDTTGSTVTVMDKQQFSDTSVTPKRVSGGKGF